MCQIFSILETPKRLLELIECPQWTVYGYLQVLQQLCQVLQWSVLVAGEFAPKVVMLLLQFVVDLIGLLEELSGAANNISRC